MRSRAEINQEYSNCACSLGDKIYKQALLGAEIQALQQKMHALAQEKAEGEVPPSPPEEPKAVA